MVVQHAFTGDNTADRLINVFVISPSTQSERQVSTSTTVRELKSKLQVVTGIHPNSQNLSLQDGSMPATTYELEEGATLAVLDDDDRTLGSYGLNSDGHIIKVAPSDSRLTSTLSSYIEDPNVQKFELTQEEYAQRRDTVMAYKARNKIGRFASPPPEDAMTTAAAPLPEGLQAGARVRVDASSTGINIKLGTVRYVGETSFAKGVWVGVEYDEPVGKNDGSIDGERYFTCRSKYGGFVKPDKCAVGDWQAEEINTDDELGSDID